MNQEKIIVGIDPDSKKSGVAFLTPHGVTILSLSFMELVDYISKFSESDLIIAVEAGYLNKSNWHVKGNNVKKNVEIGRRTGENHAVAKLLVQSLRELGYQVEELRPLAKVWRKGKISREELSELLEEEKILANKIVTNQEERDAVLLALAFKKKREMRSGNDR